MSSEDQAVRHVSFGGSEIEQAAAGDINNYYNSRKLNPAECWELKHKVQLLEISTGQSAKAIWTELKKTLGVGLQDYRLEHKDTAHRLLDLMLAAEQARKRVGEQDKLLAQLAATAQQLQLQKQIADTAVKHKKAAELEVCELQLALQQTRLGRRMAWLTCLAMLPIAGWLGMNYSATASPVMRPPVCSMGDLVYSPGVVADLPGQGLMRCELNLAGQTMWVAAEMPAGKRKKKSP